MEPSKKPRRRDKLLSLLPSRARGQSPFPRTATTTATTSSHPRSTTSLVSTHGEVGAAAAALQPSAIPTSSSLHSAYASASGSVATYADTYRTPSPPERLWDRAYDDLNKEEPDLIHAYEKILSCNLHEDGFSSKVDDSQPNAIVQHDPDRRRHQMEKLIHTGLSKTAREAKMKANLGPAMSIVLSAKETISFAIQSLPQAALAWTGICVALEVSSSKNRNFTR